MKFWLIAALSLIPQQQQGAAISGVVLSDDASPVPIRHARVELTGPGKQALVTGDDGRFAFNGLAAGRYEITVDKLGVGRRVFSANLLSPVATVIALAPAQQLSALRIILPRGGVIAGRVTGAGGAPLDGATVIAFERELLASANSSSRTPISAETDDEGQYRLFGLAPGNYVIRVSPKSVGGARDASLVVSSETYYPNAGVARDAVTVTLAAREERPGIDIAVSQGKRVEVSGTVRDAAGEIVEADVRLTPAVAFANDKDLRTVARGGAFIFDAVPPGAYVVRATHRSAASGEERTVTLSAVEAIELWNRDQTGMALVVRPEVSLNGKAEFADAGSLRGRISTAAGLGAPELAIVVINADRKKWGTAAGKPIVVWPDTNGDWSIEALAAGDYHVAALGDVTPADLARVDFLEAVANASVTVGVKAGVTSVQDLKIR